MGNILLGVGILLLVLGVAGSFMSVAIIGKQKRKERDIHSMSGTVTRHPVMANPIFLMFVAFLVIIGVAIMFFYWYYGYTDV